ncbi:MAG: phosphoketolase family protein, partial [Candidatus Nanopelagicales bacterium]|nr:phosphoketolase family protein [Candidatus Nanopelagicales bacterium]
YAISHAFGAAFDNPELVVACVVGDGEAETGPLATSWHSNKFLNPVTDGAVLPVLHLNGYKIANPTVLSRIPHEELTALLVGYGWKPHFVEGSDPEQMHQLMAHTLDTVMSEIDAIQRAAREEGRTTRPQWPMIVLRSPKGWTGPATVDGKQVEGTWRSHQVPLHDTHNNPGHARLLQQWLKSYRPQDLFDEQGRPAPDLLAMAPEGDKRMSAQPYANGGRLMTQLRLPDWMDYCVPVSAPATTWHEPTRVLGGFVRDVMRDNLAAGNFRIFGPDETESNRLGGVLEVTGKTWEAQILDEEWDSSLALDGRVMEILSEHTCQGWLEGYLLTGRHGMFSCYEAFIHIVDSMFNQHAKWLNTTRDIGWRAPISSLNYLLTSHVWRQDHNGFSHQDPGFIDHVVNKKPDVIRVYLPPDTNTLLSTMDHCLRSKDYVNVVVAGKQPVLDIMDAQQARLHCTRGIGILDWASSDGGGEPDVVLACAGDVPTMEVLAAAAILHENLPDLRVRVINVVDLMRLLPHSEHPHGLRDSEFDALFTTDKPVIFNYHGYPWLIHRLTYARNGHENFHVRGYKEEGTTTTPFDMCVMNDIDRFHLVIDVIDRVEGLGSNAAGLRQDMVDRRLAHRHYIREHGEDPSEIRDWTWPFAGGGPTRSR